MAPFEVVGERIPNLTWAGLCKYLGAEFGLQGPTKWAGARLVEDLRRLSAAYLKPQQKIMLLRAYLIPSSYYHLLLQRVSLGALRGMDRAVRASVRKILHLPGDTPVPMFLHHPGDGRLGDPELEVVLPKLREKLRLRLEARGGIWEVVARGVQVPVSGRQRRLLVTEFCDGLGLAESRRQPGCHSWMSDGTVLMNGSNYVEAVKIRLGVVNTKERAIRRRPHVLQDKVCDLGCSRVESLGHILQECPAVAPLRSQRHDAVNRTLSTALEGAGFEVLVEPTIPTEAGILRPDIVAWNNQKAWVIDTTIAADAHGANMSMVFNRKCTYDTRDIRHWVSTRTARDEVHVSALVMNWRGDMCPRSFSLLRSLGVERAIKIMEVRNLEGSARILRFFRAASGRWG
ncbi:UNVERIFIED_CONTAM: hypothetical protein RMT77_002538 [Armadillidium vulgare]